MYARRPNGIVNAAVLQRIHHQPEAIGRRSNFDTFGAQQIDLSGRKSFGAELVFQATDAIVVGLTIFQMTGHKVEAKSGGPVGRSLGPRGG